MYSLKTVLVVLAALMGVAVCEVVPFKACPVNDCDIAEVRVDPCARNNPNAACSLRRRKPATMELDFTPNFDAESLDVTLHWVMPSGPELPLISMDKDGCKYTKCPVKSGEKQTYSVEIPMDGKFPLNSYTIKWTLKSPSGKQCCYTHDIKLVR